jgi:hypothetical protein
MNYLWLAGQSQYALATQFWSQKRCFTPEMACFYHLSASFQGQDGQKLLGALEHNPQIILHHHSGRNRPEKTPFCLQYLRQNGELVEKALV